MRVDQATFNAIWICVMIVIQLTLGIVIMIIIDQLTFTRQDYTNWRWINPRHLKTSIKSWPIHPLQRSTLVECSETFIDLIYLEERNGLIFEWYLKNQESLNKNIYLKEKLWIKKWRLTV